MFFANQRQAKKLNAWPDFKRQSSIFSQIFNLQGGGVKPKIVGGRDKWLITARPYLRGVTKLELQGDFQGLNRETSERIVVKNHQNEEMSSIDGSLKEQD